MGRQVSVQETREVLVEHVQRADLILRELVRPLEVVCLDLPLFLFRLHFFSGDLAGRQSREELVYLVL